MLSFASPPPESKPEVFVGFIVQIRYGVTGEGRLTPFTPDDPQFDLRFREWTTNGFSSRTHGAEELNQAHLETGWQTRVLPGVAERRRNGAVEFFALH